MTKSARCGLGLAFLLCADLEAAANNDSLLLTALARAEDLRLASDPTFSQAVASTNPALRERAALAMGRLQAAEHTAALLTLGLADAATEVRRAALFALGQLGLAEGAQLGGEVVKPLFQLLSSPDPETKALAIEAMGKLAPDGAAEWLLAGLADPLPRIRAEAALALFRLRFVPVWRRQAEQPPPWPDSARQALLALFEDPEPTVRRAAVYAFSRFGDEEAVQTLLPKLADPDELTRLFAARAIGKSGKHGAARALSGRAEEPRAAVRAELVIALGTLDRADLIPPAWLADSSFHVRAAAARALAAASSEQSLTELHKLEADASPTVRAAAVEALAKRLQGAYASSLAKLLEGPVWTDRVAAARGAALLGAGGLELLSRALQDPDRRVATAAVEGLGKLPGAEVDALLVKALASPDLAVRGSAVAVVGERESMPRVKLLDAAYEASPGEPWIELRENIADALPELPGGLAVLQKLVGRDPAPSVRSRAAAGLAKKGIQVSLPPPVAAQPSPHLGTSFKRNPTITIETTKGPIEIECFASETPIHCASFVALVKKGFYNGSIWHRVVTNFVVQGGDPRGDGWGGAGTTWRDEIHRRRYEAGSVGMPKGGKDTGGGQLFITHLPTPHLDGNYTLFGRVTKGLEVVAKLEIGDQILKVKVKR